MRSLVSVTLFSKPVCGRVGVRLCDLIIYAQQGLFEIVVLIQINISTMSFFHKNCNFSKNGTIRKEF